MAEHSKQDFATGGDADWFYQTATYYYDGDAAQSGNIYHNQESWMQTTVSGPGALSFYWKVSSEGSYDFLEFYVDGVRQDRISSLVGWEISPLVVMLTGSIRQRHITMMEMLPRVEISTIIKNRGCRLQ